MNLQKFSSLLLFSAFLAVPGFASADECDLILDASYEILDEGEEGESNVIKNEGALSSPVVVSFTAETTDDVVFYEWQVATDPEFFGVVTKSQTKDFEYTFIDEGTYYVQFSAATENDECTDFSEVFNFQIASSDLVIPNAFSPNGDGINDIWKVSYRSLIDFNCQIFNRNGQPIYSFTDPAGGWDGTYHGKTVKSGVYYYVIVATGSDGQKYKKSGDINVINSRYNGSVATPDPEE